MARQLARKVVQLVVVLLVVSFLTFLLISLLPGGPEFAILGPNATEEAVERLRNDLNLDDPLPVRYVSWLGDVVTGDLGVSYVQGRTPVTELLGQRLGVTLLLMLYAQILALGVAIPLGILAAYKADSLIDRTASISSFGLLSVPNFVLAVLLVYLLALGGFELFGIKIGTDYFRATGYVGFADSPTDHFRSMFLPALALAAGQMAVYMRLLRTDMIATLREDFIAMARAKGIPTRRILLRHAFRPSSLSLLTVAGINVGALIGGTVVIEQIFVINGIGNLLVRSIFTRDYLVLQSVVLIVAAGFVLVNFLVDLLYLVLDPRVRHSEGGG